MDKHGLIDEILFGLWILMCIVVFAFLFVMWYYDYKDWQDTKKLIREHNGTCIDKGYSVECSYKDTEKIITSTSDTEKIITSTSKCYRNDIEINCSEIGT